MSTSRHDERFGTRNLVIVMGCIATGLLTLPAVVPFWKSHPGWLGLLVLFAPAICVGGVGLLLGYRVHRRYRCEECGGFAVLIPTPAGKPLQYRYHCERCDITWETGMTEGDA